MAHLFLASKMAAPDDGGGVHNKTTIPRMPTKSAMKPPSSSSSLRPPAASSSSSDKKTGTLPPATGGKADAVLLIINEAGLTMTAATGGTEASCYRCTVPFGVVVVIAGAVVTAVAYAFNAHGSTISVLGLAMLSTGLGLLAASALCWRLRRRRGEQQQRDTRRESQTALITAEDNA